MHHAGETTIIAGTDIQACCAAALCKPICAFVDINDIFQSDLNGIQFQTMSLLERIQNCISNHNLDLQSFMDYRIRCLISKSSSNKLTIIYCIVFSLLNKAFLCIKQLLLVLYIFFLKNSTMLFKYCDCSSINLKIIRFKNNWCIWIPTLEMLF
ncbi:Hypothetical_protein [Hexamita inflata]|uniref:Hypothetical_protein n=1 Tax=Hexamita inflata TaxID=28002 RepID=A0AA86VC39_9EUKA|nr:Hypothetical protein HINF_LOCUS50118 [Hexamita inflata]